VLDLKPTRAALLRARAAGCGGALTNVRAGEQKSRLPLHFTYLIS